jgi:hypothetical protein
MDTWGFYLVKSVLIRHDLRQKIDHPEKNSEKNLLAQHCPWLPPPAHTTTLYIFFKIFSNFEHQQLPTTKQSPAAGLRGVRYPFPTHAIKEKKSE